MTRLDQSSKRVAGVPSSGMPFYTAQDERSSICMDCFLTVVPRDGQTLDDAQTAHECGVSKLDQEEREQCRKKRSKNFF
jgi:hypothetical protein